MARPTTDQKRSIGIRQLGNAAANIGNEDSSIDAIENVVSTALHRLASYIEFGETFGYVTAVSLRRLADMIDP